MAKSDPITGPYPDGDSRNITLTKSDNSIEPNRTGPQEAKFREDDDDSDESPEQASSSDEAPHAEMGFGSVGGALPQAGEDIARQMRSDAMRPLGKS